MSILESPRPLIWPLHNDTIHRIGPGADFYAVYHAGVNVRRGLSPYANNPDGVTPAFYPFRYLPGVAFAAEALTFLAPEHAYRVWIVALEALLGLVIVVLRPRVAESTWLALSALLLVSSPYFLELYMGQFTFAAVALCAIGLLTGRAWPFALGAVLKAFPVAALPAFLRSPRRRPVVVWTAAAVALVSIPFFLARPAEAQRFMAVNLSPVGALDSGNYSSLMLLRLVAIDLGATPLVANWNVVVGTVRVAILAGCAVVVLLAHEPDPTVGAAALLLAHFVTYQHVWEHSLSGVVLLGALLFAAESLTKRDHVFLWMCLIVCALPTPFAVFDRAKDPSLWEPAFAWPRYASYLVVLPKAAPAIGLFLWCVRRLVSKRDSQRESPQGDGTLLKCSL